MSIVQTLPQNLAAQNPKTLNSIFFVGRRQESRIATATLDKNPLISHPSKPHLALSHPYEKNSASIFAATPAEKRASPEASLKTPLA